MESPSIEGNTFLVTGGANLIGSHIAQSLLHKKAKRVIIYDNFYFGPAKHVDSIFEDPRIELVRGDVMRLDQLLAAMKGVDGVFSMAALLTAPLAKDPLVGVRVNVEGLINQLEACRFSGVKKLILASSIAVYGAPTQSLISESNPWVPNNLTPPFAMYSLTKLLGENLGRYYANMHGVNFSATRFSTVYGERQHDRGVNTQAIPRTINSIREGKSPELPGGGHDAHDYIHAQDVALGTLHAMEHGVTGESYNISSGVSTTTREVVQLVIDAMDSSLKIVDVDDTRSDRGTIESSLDIDISKAKKDLGWEPTISVKEGVYRLVEWYQNEEALK